MGTDILLTTKSVVSILPSGSERTSNRLMAEFGGNYEMQGTEQARIPGELVETESEHDGERR
jgi:hypothetical protein